MNREAWEDTALLGEEPHAGGGHPFGGATVEAVTVEHNAAGTGPQQPA